MVENNISNGGNLGFERRRLNKKPTYREEANALVHQCVRAGFIEEIHAGVSPSSAKKDFSDVKVVSHYGEIQWNELSRITDEEMKKLMIEISSKLAEFLEKKEKYPEQYKKEINLTTLMYTPEWEKILSEYHIGEKK